MKLSLLPTVLMASALVFPACKPAGQTSGAGDRFAEADTNKDGKLSRNEASDYIVIGVFETLDVNKDGKLSLSECAVEGAPATVKNFAKRDLNKDGYVTKAEAVSAGRKNPVLKKAFAEADKNKDGYLTREEVVTYYGSKEGAPN